jgi:hypothetical protein
LIALIDAMVEKKGEVDLDLGLAMERVEHALNEKDTGVSSWTLYHLVQLGVRAGKADEVAKFEMVRLIPDADLRSRSNLEIIMATYAYGPATEALNHLAAQKPPCRHALLVLSRQNARYGSSSAVSKAVDGWEQELRPLGYAGIALGLQDTEK